MEWPERRDIIMTFCTDVLEADDDDEDDEPTLGLIFRLLKTL